MTRSDFDFEELVGEEFDFFYGATERFFKLDDTVYEAIEETLSGIESSQLGHVEICKDSRKDTFALPIARIVIEEDDEVYVFVDLHDGHEWLRFGTIHQDDGWQFIFHYTPKDTHNEL